MKYTTPEDHHAQRREVHPSQRQLHVEPISSPLHVISAHFNPNRYRARPKLAQAFEKHCTDSGAIPWTVELALRDRHFEVTDHNNPHHIQLRGESELWYKENLGNIATRHLPFDAENIAFVDGDFLFTRADWATETVHMLQHYDAVQMFHHLTYETHDHRTHGHLDGFAYLHVNQSPKLPKHYGHRGAVGGAWAFRRSALDKLGGLLDRCILGSADWHMAFALAMRDDVHPDMNLGKAPQYVKIIRDWAENAKVLRGNIGYVNCHAIHHWHGPMSKRGYEWRANILTGNQYDPNTHVRYDMYGVLQLNKNAPNAHLLRDELRAYFRQRDEDSISLKGE